jgi:hypothetical protein
MVFISTVERFDDAHMALTPSKQRHNTKQQQQDEYYSIMNGTQPLGKPTAFQAAT